MVRHKPVEEYRNVIRGMVREGMTMPQIEAVLGISERMLRKYYPDEIKGRSIGCPPHQPTETSKSMVESMSGMGVPQPEIARMLGISHQVLLRHYEQEIHEGRTKANHEIARCLFKAAKGGNVVAQMFWLKTRAGWRERIVVSGDQDAPIKIQQQEQEVNLESLSTKELRALDMLMEKIVPQVTGVDPDSVVIDHEPGE